MLMNDQEQRNAFLAAIIDSSEDAIISKDLSGQITSWNKSAERMFGYTEAEMIGKSVYLLIPEDRKKEEEMIISHLKKGQPVEHYETIRLAKSGEPLPISLTVSPIRNAQGQVVGASKIVRNIKEQKESAEMIRQYAYRLEQINAIGKTINAQLDVNTILQKVTDVTTQLCGAAFGAFFYNKTDVKGESYMLFALSGAPREAFEKFGMPRNTDVFRPTFEGEGVVRSDDITKDPRYGRNAPHKGMPTGHLPVVSYLAVPVKSQSGIVIGGLFFGHPKPGMFREEHEHVVDAVASSAAIALDNAKLYEEVQALNNKKDEFIGFVSHELKTPLTTMSGYIQLATQQLYLPADISNKMSKQIVRLNGIISDLLDISRIQAGKFNLDFKRTSLHAIIRDSIDMVSHEHKIDIAMPAEDIMVTVDGQKIFQVISNLISNAVKYSSVGSEIDIAAIRLGDQIKVSVTDKGVGIPALHLDKIFNQFYRVPKTSNQQGAGLGLYISKEIIEGHIGKIWVESEEGKGSTFHVLFPIEKMKGT
jgi:PAS domain S-box-containing protein